MPRGAEGQYACAICLATTRKGPALATRWHSHCKGYNVNFRTLLGGGNGHTIAVGVCNDAPFACCVRCGGYATTHARSLRLGCPGAPHSGAGHAALKRIARGLHPRGHAKVTELWALGSARRVAIGSAPVRQATPCDARQVEGGAAQPAQEGVIALRRDSAEASQLAARSGKRPADDSRSGVTDSGRRVSGRAGAAAASATPFDAGPQPAAPSLSRAEHNLAVADFERVAREQECGLARGVTGLDAGARAAPLSQGRK